MRKRDSKHQAQLASIQPLGPPELIRRIGIGDHNDSSHIASEVLATLIRNRFGQADGVVGAAVEELNRRIQVLVGKRMRGMMGAVTGPSWPARLAGGRTSSDHAGNQGPKLT